MSKPRTRIPGATAWTGYGVPNPDDGTPTYWWVDGELRMRPWPAGTRYAPLPPPYDAVNRSARREHRTDFYEGVYFPFLRQVADTIAADLDGAAARFTAIFGVVAFPRRQDAARRALVAEQERTRAYEQVRAAMLVRRGASVAEVARTLGVSWETARTRLRAGQQLLAEDPEQASRAVTDHLGRLFEPGEAERLAAVVLAGSTDAGWLAAADHSERKPGRRQDTGDGWAQTLSAALDNRAGERA
jgi:transposase-like protein